jgi:hypothetical protein
MERVQPTPTRIEPSDFEKNGKKREVEAYDAF